MLRSGHGERERRLAELARRLPSETKAAYPNGNRLRANIRALSDALEKL